MSNENTRTNLRARVKREVSHTAATAHAAKAAVKHVACVEKSARIDIAATAQAALDAMKHRSNEEETALAMSTAERAQTLSHLTQELATATGQEDLQEVARILEAMQRLQKK